MSEIGTFKLSLGQLFDWKKLFKNIQYLFCNSVPKSGQNRPTYVFCVRNEYLLKVEYCQKLLNSGHFGSQSQTKGCLIYIGNRDSPTVRNQDKQS